MFKYAIITKSESGDDYVYLVQSQKDLSYKQAEKWLKKNGNDCGYETIIDIIDILDDEFITIK